MTETKGQTTKNHILREGVQLASVNGLINISIGSLAARANMSRSGLFAHFLSKEQLQLDILTHAGELFVQTVIEPCEKEEQPEDKLFMMQKIWPDWFDRTEPAIPGGCIFLIASLEFDDRPGKIKDFLVEQQARLLKYIGKTYSDAQEKGFFNDSIDYKQFAYEFYSLYMGYNSYRKFFGDTQSKERYNNAIESLYTRAGATRSLN
ncbi:MAG: TetR/AcrR family transcriptional regulator [Bdellovibrionales bacterium]|nr:TetR/AcrR family transcriptional regulator [Bdellovibrionales bacterium]NQZ19767.1 TetR/AcrR family transcriptional regulator [Bdellovibrionales bacterium]